MRISTVAALAVLAVGLAGLIGAGMARGPGAGEGAHVAVCDIEAVMNGYQRAKDLKDKITEEEKKTAADQKKSADAINQLKEQIEKVLQPGSKEYDARVAELQELSIRYEVGRRVNEQTLDTRFRQLTEDMYREVNAAVEAIAKERKIDLVMFRENVDIASQSTREVFTKITRRKCLYANPAIDITAACLDRLNTQYKPAPK